jgi:hypothetical protein
MTKDVFKEVEELPFPVRLQKFSSKTSTLDATHVDMSEALKKALYADPKLVSKVWRAKVGQQRRWHYAFSLGEALEKALHGGGLE